MASIRKRRQDEPPELGRESLQASPMLARLRNMWQFASLCQWLYIFGGVVKLDNLDIDDLEIQCLSPHSTALQDIGLALLKYLSSHRGLTNDLFDEYTRRQYATKAPELLNPFGDGEEPAKFSSFTVYQRVRVLHQMTSFVMMNPEKLREKMAEQKDADHDQTTWRIEPFGWDRDDRVYFVLDDNRVYRLTEAPPPLPKPKKNTKKARAQARRSSKRRRISSSVLDDAVDDTEDEPVINSAEQAQLEDADVEDLNNGLGGMKWECVAVSLDDLRVLLATISSKKDPNEKVLHDKIAEHLLPILEQQDERRKKREREREKELLNLAKMATAKRSSRIAGRQEQQRHEEMLREEEQKRRLELETHRKEEQRQRKMEKEREARLLSREKRLHEREVRRAQHEDELAQLSEDSKALDGAAGRMSERRRQAEIARNKEALRDLAEEGEEEEWTFDCVCGLHGKVDDGQHSVSCETCNIWQHSKCLGIDEQEAEKDDFHFVCNSCKGKAIATANGHTNGRPIIRIKVNKPAIEMPPDHFSLSVDIPLAPTPGPVPNQVPTVSQPGPSSGTEQESKYAGIEKNYSSVRSGAVIAPVALPALGPPAVNSDMNSIPVKVDGLVYPSTTTLASKPSQGATGGSVTLVPGTVQKGTPINPFSLPRPGLSQPDQSPRRSHAYGTIHEPSSSVLQGSPTPQAPMHLGSPTPAASTPASNTQVHWTPSSLATPRLHHLQGDGLQANTSEQFSSPLPSHGGLSPTKHSPVIARDHPSVFNGTTSTPSIIPPTAALSPSTPEQILVPPIKPEGLAHRQSFSSAAADLVPKPRSSED